MMVVSALRHTTKTSSPVVELRKKQWGERRATPRRRKRRDFDAVYCMGSTTAVGGIPRPTGNSSMVITVRTAAATDSYRERTIDRRTDGRTDRQTDRCHITQLSHREDSPAGSSQRSDWMRQVAKEKWISDKTFTAIREKRKAKGKVKNRYQELKADVQRKLRVDKQQQLEGMCVELEAANSKENSRQLFQIF